MYPGIRRLSAEILSAETVSVACWQFGGLRQSVALCHFIELMFPACSDSTGGAVAEWLACWTQAQNGPGSNHSRDTVG